MKNNPFDNINPTNTSAKAVVSPVADSGIVKQEEGFSKPSKSKITSNNLNTSNAKTPVTMRLSESTQHMINEYQANYYRENNVKITVGDLVETALTHYINQQ